MQVSDIVPLLERFELFKEISAPEWSAIFDQDGFRVRQFPPGAVIHLQHDPCHCLDVLLDGQVSVQRIDAEGRVLTIETFRSPDIVGANLLFAFRNRYPMTVMSETRTVVLQLPRDQVLQLFSEHRSFFRAFLRLISERSLTLTDTIHTLSTPSVRQRILDYVHYQRVLQGSSNILLPESKKGLAERLGMQRTSLSRELHKMKAEGILTYDVRSITLRASSGEEFDGPNA